MPSAEQWTGSRARQHRQRGEERVTRLRQVSGRAHQVTGQMQHANLMPAESMPAPIAALKGGPSLSDAEQEFLAALAFLIMILGSFDAELSMALAFLATVS